MHLQSHIFKILLERHQANGLSLVVKCASSIIMSLFPSQDCYNRYLFPTRSGTTFLWILSKDYLSLKVVIPFWLWWTGCPNILISYHYPTPLLSQVAQLFLTEIVKLHDIPCSIISDRDKVFVSSFRSELLRLLGLDLRLSSAYHPQMDGQTEVVNRCVETYLRCFSADKLSRWSEWLAWAEYNYNTSLHIATGVTPFIVVYGRDPPPIVRFEWGSTANQEVESHSLQRDAILEELKRHLQ